MKYSLTIEKSNSRYYTYKNDIPTWDKVREILRSGLDQWTTKVHIYKWSSNDRCLGSKCVTMGNLWDIANSANDKVLL